MNPQHEGGGFIPVGVVLRGTGAGTPDMSSARASKVKGEVCRV